MAGLLLLSPEERCVELLEGSKKKILERVPQHYITNYLGVTPVSMAGPKRPRSQSYSAEISCR